MKTILLLIVLTGFTAAGSYAQNKECKTVTHKTVRKAVITPRVPANGQDPSCFLIKKENLGIPGCMNMTYSSENAYLGYYAKKDVVGYRIPKAPKVKTVTVAEDQPEPQPFVPFFSKVSYDPVLPCRTYVHNDIIVRECPGKFYDNEKWPLTSAPIMQYYSDDTYMGYYPDKETREIKDPRKMENRELDEPTHFPGDDLCFKNCK